MDDDAYRHIDSIREHMLAGVEATIAEYELAAHTVAFGAKGCVTFSPTRIRNYRALVG